MIADKDTTAGKVTIAAIVDAADGADVGEDDAAEAEIVGIKADAISRHRSTHRRKGSGAATIIGARVIGVRDLRDRRNRARTKFCCQASRWRSIAGGHSRHRQSRRWSRKSGSRISNGRPGDPRLALQLRLGDHGDSREVCRIGCWPITSLPAKLPRRNTAKKQAPR
jgi:hypothetical protein